MKHVAILGGGIYQAPMIRRAVERGHRVFVASMSPDDPGMGLAHERWTVNLTDRERILELVRDNRIDAVATTGTEFSIPTIAYVCERLGLPGIGMDTALISTSKVRTQERFAAEGVPAAAFRRVTTPGEALAAARDIGWPVFVKAPDSSGSRGISMASNPEELRGAFAEAVRYSRDGVVLVEEKLDGIEFGAQVIAVAGEVAACLCHNDTVTPPPVTVPVGHSLPFRESESIAREARDVCTSAVRALGIDNAVCNADLIATPDGVRMFEIGARIGATGLAEIVALHYGVGLYDIALDMALGEKPSFTVTNGPAAAYRIIEAPATGKLVRCDVPDTVKSVPGLVEAHFDYSAGAHVRAFRTGPDRIGHVLVTAETADDAETLAETVIGMLDIRIG